MRLIVSLLTVILSVTLLYTPSNVHADSNIEIISDAVSSNFPDGIIFKVSARSSSTIEEIKVEYKLPGSDITSYGYMDFTPAKNVSGEYLLNTSGRRDHIPPGTAFTYVLEARNSKGQELRTEEKKVIYMDNRFEWSQITEGNVRVFYYGPVERRARTILDAALKTVTEMGKLLGVPQPEPIRIVAYNNSRHLAMALPPRSAAVKQELTTEGMAFNDMQVVVLMAFEPSIEGTTSHEVVHMLVGDATQKAYRSIPAWLNEGLAEYGNLDPTESYDQALYYAIFTRKLKPLWYLQEFSGDPDDIIIGYGQARSVVRHIIDVYGAEKMAALMKAIQETLDIDAALKQVYGFDQHGLDTQWRTALGLEPFPPPQELHQQIQAPVTDTTTSSPTPLPENTVQTTAEQPSDTKPSPSCNIARTSNTSKEASIPVDLAMLGLIGGPFTIFSFWRINRHRNE